jgi:hypothetical protein
MEQLKPLLEKTYAESEIRLNAEKEFLELKINETKLDLLSLTKTPEYNQYYNNSDTYVQSRNYDDKPSLYQSEFEKRTQDISKAPPIPTKPSNAAQILLSEFNSDFHDLRQMSLPRSLMEEFLQISENNSRRKLETCGIICGKLVKNLFWITHLF